jgi:queuine tRNA-ribosyltransferase
LKNVFIVNQFNFKITKKSKKSAARTGLFSTPHGKIRTPAFVPVATKGALKGGDHSRVNQIGFEILMMNTFHLFCNERYKEVARFGGLHKFTGTEVPIMTDSGGFQVFSLGSGWQQGVGKLANVDSSKRDFKKRAKVDDNGVVFRSPINGKVLKMTPEISMKVQEKLGADIIFAFDECSSPLDTENYTKISVERTYNWAQRSLNAFNGNNQVILGVVQGGPYLELRRESAQSLADLPFFGFGIGGSFGGSYGDSKKSMYRVLEEVIPILPQSKPRHLLGIGEPDDIVEAVSRGVDLFDCVIPVRWARHGVAMTSSGRVNLRQTKFLEKSGPLDRRCSCRVCSDYQTAYITHLIRERELYGIYLLAEHNLFWVLSLMREIRKSIRQGSFPNLKRKILNDWKRSED